MSANSPLLRVPISRLVFAGVLLPAAFVTLDRLLLDFVAGAYRTDWIMAATMGVFVIQIGLMGVVCGRWIEWPALRWLLYAWCWLLIDFQILIAWALAGQNWWGDAFQAASLIAAQLGLVVIWAVLGTTRWTVRLTVSLVVGSLLLLPLIRFRYWGDNVAMMFAVQMVVFGGICLRLQSQGFRLRIAETATGANLPRAAVELRTSQFGIRDVLMWTTALGFVCGLIRAVGLPLQDLILAHDWGWISVFSSGAAVAIVLVLALWAGLGTGGDCRRWLCAAVLVLTAAELCGLIDWGARLWERQIWTAPWVRRLSWWEWVEWYYNEEKLLVTWLCLASGMLFATLLFLRAIGYRLRRKGTLPPAIGGKT